MLGFNDCLGDLVSIHYKCYARNSNVLQALLSLKAALVWGFLFCFMFHTSSEKVSFIFRGLCFD